jgi:hypothetical protein
MTTPNLELPEVNQSQTTEADDLNEGFWALDAIVQASVIDDGIGTPPSSPSQGDRYLVPAGSPAATGDWVGHERHLAYYTVSGWRFRVPRPGWRVLVQSTDVTQFYDGTEWVEVGTLQGGSGIAVSNPGSTTANPTIDLDLGSLSEIAGVDGAADFVVVLDATDGVHKKVRPQNLPAGGGGFSSGAGGSLPDGNTGDLLVFNGTSWVPNGPTDDLADDNFAFGDDWDTAGARRPGSPQPIAWTKHENSTAPTTYNARTAVDGIGRPNGLIIEMPAVSGPYFYTQPVPAQSPEYPWEYEAILAMGIRDATLMANYQYVGLGVYASASTRNHSVNLIHSTSIRFEQWRNTGFTYSTSSSVYVPDDVSDTHWMRPFGMRISYDGTNIYFKVSPSGYPGTYFQIYAVARTSWINDTITDVGIFMRGSSAGSTPIIFQWRRIT